MTRRPPVVVDIISDDDDGSPLPSRPRKRLDIGGGGNDAGPPPTVLIINDDPTPQKSNPICTPSFVAESSLSAFGSDASMVRCSLARSDRGSISPLLPAAAAADKFAGVTDLICLESDNELEGSSHEGSSKKFVSRTGVFDLTMQSEMRSSFSRPSSPVSSGYENRDVGLRTPEKQAAIGSNDENGVVSEKTNHRSFDGWSGNMDLPDAMYSPPHADFFARGALTELRGFDYEERNNLRQADSPAKQKDSPVKQKDSTKKKGKTVDADKNKLKNDEASRKQQLKEEKHRLNEERKRKRQEEKLQKEAMKAETAAMKKVEKEKQKWERGKFAIKSIVAEVDAKVVEVGSVGGHLLTRLAEKGLSFRITSNPVERSILWQMSLPDEIAQVSSVGAEVPYILFVFQAEDFCNLVNSGSFMDHVNRVRSQYPSFTICYLTNKLMSYVNKCEQAHYRNPGKDGSFKRPPVEEVLSKLTTHFTKVHSRQCIDEAELAEHIVGLTSSLATCQFRKKLTWLSVNANGAIIPKDFIDRKLIKNSLWLKALIAIPKVQPRYALAIWKKYPTMRSLLNVYMDPNKSVHEKQFLLKDLMTEGLLGDENRRLGEVCSTRVYRILMAQSGRIKTDDVEDGADYFGG